MKSLFKIIRRYMLTALFILTIMFLVNVALFAFLSYIGYQNTVEDAPMTGGLGTRDTLEQLGEEFQESRGRYEMTDTGLRLLEESVYVWAMYIDGDGRVGWSWQLPGEIPLSYTMADVSVLSKWYVEDYPVRTWIHGDGLMVYAREKNSVIRTNGEYSVAFVKNLPRYVLIWIMANLLLILMLVLFMGYRFYRSLQPLAYGIEELSHRKSIYIPPRGVSEELVQQLNETSRILEEQDRKLTRRDNARTEWIAGVSHDIRTPLALIIGYSAGLSQDESLGKEQQEKAGAIQRQSLTIKKLIEDLNLTSKLEYNVQPLRLGEYSPGPLLREIAADYYNDGLDSKYEISLSVDQQVETVKAQGDIALLKRCFRNLIGNSIRHNEKGCMVTIKLLKYGENSTQYTIMDSGAGIPAQVVEVLEGVSRRADSGEVPHVMGLRVVSRIVKAHHGELKFPKRPSGSSDVQIIL